MILNHDIKNTSYPTTSFQGNGFRIVRALFSSNTSFLDNASYHTIQLNDGAPFTISWQSKDCLEIDICQPGNLIQLLSKGKQNRLQCEEEYSAIEVVFEPAFIDAILEKDNFSFGDRLNFEDPLLARLIKELLSATYSKTPEMLYIDSLAVACAIHLGTTYTENNKRIFSLKGKLSSHQLNSVISFVRSTINRTVTLEELAICCHLSVFHFSRLFKNTLGISPYQYVLRTKIEQARALIKSKRQVGDVAYSLGFTDSAHFCNAFKKLTGHSPLQYIAATTALGSTPHSISRIVPMS